jgi:hypothetical protein
MRRITTPTHIFSLPEDLTVDSLGDVIITYAQDHKPLIEKRLSDIEVDGEKNALILTLTQEETKKFHSGKAKVQVRALTSENKVLASQIVSFYVKPVINQEVL